MKLLKCPQCGDIVALRPWRKSCKCGLVYGLFLEDNETVMVSPESTVWGMPNSQLFVIPSGDKYVVYQEFDSEGVEWYNVGFQE